MPDYILKICETACVFDQSVKDIYANSFVADRNRSKTYL